MTEIHKNTCPAFFTDTTINSAGAYSPCTALGGAGRSFKDKKFNEMWTSDQLNYARSRSAAGEQLKMCNRCWSEEAVGLTSERQYLIKDIPQDLNYTDPLYYLSGPRHLNIKVSNICNLRCRTCQSRDSYLYHIEGDHYMQKYDLLHSVYNQEKFKKRFTDEQLDELYAYSSNIERIELYGGEPLLDDQIPRFLTRLIENGRSKDIDLFISTNVTHEVTSTWMAIFENFKQCTINISVDGISDRFTYMRHPGEWAVAKKNIDFLFSEQFQKCNPLSPWIVPVITVSALNVWYVNEVFDYFIKNHDVEPFVILAQTPEYYCVNVIPNSVKPIVAEHLNSFNISAFSAIVNLMNTAPKLAQFMPTHLNTPWKQFLFWTAAKDEYRNESFAATFPEYYKVLKDNNQI